MRVGPGSVFPGPLKKANVVNGMLEASEHYQQQERLNDGEGRRFFGPSTDVVKVRNYSGANRREGEVLECDDTTPILTTIDPTNLWLKGVTPNGERGFGILRKASKHDATDALKAITPLQVSGVCKALVNFSDASHRAAYVESGSYVLKSSYIGPIQVLYKPSGTGEKSCVVRFFDSISISEEVQVWIGSGSPTSGDLNASNADGLHPARVRRWVSGALATHEDCWLRLVDWEDVDGDDTIAVHGRIHHAKYTGKMATSSSVTKPLYLANIEQQEFLSQPVGDIAKGSTGTVRLYNGDKTDSGLTLEACALGMEVFEDKWTTTKRLSGAWFVGCWEL